MKVVVNGRVLLLPLNGIPRYAYEVVKQLDALQDAALDIEVVLPEGTALQTTLQSIRLVHLPHSKAWDFVQAERYARQRGALYVNLASKGVLYRNSVTTVFDIRPLTYGDGKRSGKTQRTKAAFSLAYWLAAHRAKRLVTISAFSQSEIVHRNRSIAHKTVIAGCGWEHMRVISADQHVFTQHPGLPTQGYYLSIGSIAPHKNLAWICENAKLYPDNQYVIVGKTDARLWPDSVEGFTNNVHYVGYLNDTHMKALLLGARALVFPSLYEGFGIPPLEALACGIPAIVSDIPVMREIFGNAVHYLDPSVFSLNLERTLAEPVDPPDGILAAHSWQRTGARWQALLKELQGDETRG